MMWQSYTVSFYILMKIAVTILCIPYYSIIMIYHLEMYTFHISYTAILILVSSVHLIHLYLVVILLRFLKMYIYIRRSKSSNKWSINLYMRPILKQIQFTFLRIAYQVIICCSNVQEPSPSMGYIYEIDYRRNQNMINIGFLGAGISIGKCISIFGADTMIRYVTIVVLIIGPGRCYSVLSTYLLPSLSSNLRSK